MDKRGAKSDTAYVREVLEDMASASGILAARGAVKSLGGGA